MMTHRSPMFPAYCLCVWLVVGLSYSVAQEQEQPNILWISVEDMSPNLGCYGDEFATTPFIDRLAGESVRYTHAFASAPVCSPSRSCLITGMYATSTGTQSLRSTFPLPNEVLGFPQYLREAGYYTTNNVKTDYNTSDEPRLIQQSWNESSPSAHWRGREPGQPFFCVFNLMTTHQSRTGVWSFDEYEAMISERLEADERCDPANVPLPPYYPDTPLVRKSMARYYDCIQAMDKEVGAILGQLEDDGLAANTIVIFFSDHGMGMPRGKRVLHDSGMQVPLLIRVPEAFQDIAPGEAGTSTSRLVSFVDFAPTMMNLVGLPVPEYMQGHSFLGTDDAPLREYVYGARDRVDEVYDLSRSVRDDRFLYIRNYMPHLSWMQPEGYSDNAPMRREFASLLESGQLTEAQLTYAAPTRSREELYDTANDPHQIHNLAESTEHREVLEQMREAHSRWIRESHDVAFLPETEVRRRMNADSPRDVALDAKRYDLESVVKTATVDSATLSKEEFESLLGDEDAAIRYWAVLGLRQSPGISSEMVDALIPLLIDVCPPVRLEAAAIILDQQKHPGALGVIKGDLTSLHLDASLYAARICQQLGVAVAPIKEDIVVVLERARKEESKEPMQMYIRFALEPLSATLDRE